MQGLDLDYFKPMFLGGRIKNKNERTRRSDAQKLEKMHLENGSEEQTSTQQMAIGLGSKQ